MFGDGLIHGRPVSSNHASRRQFRIATTVRSAPIFFSPLNSFAELAHRQAVPDRHRRQIAGEARPRLSSSAGPFDLHAADRIRPVEHEDFDLSASPPPPSRTPSSSCTCRSACRCPAGRSRSRRGRSASRRVGPLRRAVERVDRQAGLLVRRRRHRRVEDAADAVLGAEERDELHAGRRGQQIDRRGAVARAAV